MLFFTTCIMNMFIKGDAMPKIIKGVRESILNCAKEHLLVNHEKKLSLRQIAKECDIAVGTIYNYFPDKTSLLVAVMIQDWREMLAKLDKRVQECQTMQEGVFAIYDTVYAFKQLYGSVFREFDTDSHVKEASDGRHVQLRQELENRTVILLERFGKEEVMPLSCLLTESIMTCAVRSELNKEMLWAYISRIL